MAIFAGTARQVIGRGPHLQRQNGGVPGDMLVGRRLAVGALRAAVDTAVGGAGGVVLLAGEAGMGKTALAAEAVAYAKARGAAAVWGTCWEGEGAPGFWPWIQVVRALAPTATARAKRCWPSSPASPGARRQPGRRVRGPLPHL